MGEYESIDHSMHDAYGEEAEQDRSSDDPYGGMPIELYDNIVEFKRLVLPNVHSKMGYSCLKSRFACLFRFRSLYSRSGVAF